MLRLPRLAPIGDVRRVPPRVAPGVDLDDVGAEVGQHLGAERSGDGETEVEHGDSGQRADHRGAGPAPPATADLASASASARPRRCAHRRRAPAPAPGPAYGSARRGSRPGAATPCSGCATSTTAPRRSGPGRRALPPACAPAAVAPRPGGPPRPTRRSGTGRRLRPSAGSSGPARRCSPGPGGCGRGRRVRCATSPRNSSVSPSALASTKNGLGTHCCDPPPVGAPEQALRRALVVDPRAASRRVRVFRPAATWTPSGSERRLQQRGLDVLAAPGPLPGEQRGVDRRWWPGRPCPC